MGIFDPATPDSRPEELITILCDGRIFVRGGETADPAVIGSALIEFSHRHACERAQLGYGLDDFMFKFTVMRRLQ